jgi:BirA family biotin operon repressor/biotin-[acetyl-CoA-carboxylase] ligase
VSVAYDGLGAAELARRLGAPHVELYDVVASTQDVAHALAAAGAAHGTVVLADTQTGGRGRAGRAWVSPPGSGVWLTAVTRPRDLPALGVLALRVGLALAEELAPLADGSVGVKWPNDLLVGGRKLAGILVEARWRDGQPEWAAVGVGVNVRPPAEYAAGAALRPGVARLDTAAAVVRAVAAAAAGRGPLAERELAALAGRDVVRGRAVEAPVAGVAVGVAAGGALLVRDAAGAVHEVRQAGVTFARSAPPEDPR